ncbi:MAG: hypothetical protein NT027_12050 [Proteobacteria bacterium]|nr:hypothetical protein [Pseudomonadota bacterium]
MTLGQFDILFFSQELIPPLAIACNRSEAIDDRNGSGVEVLVSAEHRIDTETCLLLVGCVEWAQAGKRGFAEEFATPQDMQLEISETVENIDVDRRRSGFV